MKERGRLLNNYFPYRSGIVLNSILALVNMDDFDVPDGWVPLTASLFHQWDKTDATARITVEDPGAELNLNASIGNGGVAAGFSSVGYNLYADLGGYDYLVLRGTGGDLRILGNRQTDHGEYKQIIVSFDEWDPYWDASLQAIVVPLADLRNSTTNRDNVRIDDVTHLNALKVQSGTVVLRGAWLTSAVHTSVDGVRQLPADGVYYNLNGQKVVRPVRGGIYILNGKKIIVK